VLSGRASTRPPGQKPLGLFNHVHLQEGPFWKLNHRENHIITNKIIDMEINLLFLPYMLSI